MTPRPQAPPELSATEIHEFGNFTDGVTSAGEIFNPDCKPHGAPDEAERMGEARWGAEGILKAMQLAT